MNKKICIYISLFASLKEWTKIPVTYKSEILNLCNMRNHSYVNIFCHCTNGKNKDFLFLISQKMSQMRSADCKPIYAKIECFGSVLFIERWNFEPWTCSLFKEKPLYIIYSIYLVKICKSVTKICIRNCLLSI